MPRLLRKLTHYLFAEDDFLSDFLSVDLLSVFFLSDFLVSLLLLPDDEEDCFSDVFLEEFLLLLEELELVEDFDALLDLPVLLRQ